MSLLRELQLPTPKNEPVATKGDGSTHAQAAEAWRGVLRLAQERIDALKKSVQAQCSDEPPALAQAVGKGLARLDTALAGVDQRLAQALEQADNAADAKARAAALKTAKALVAETIGAVAKAPLIAQIDQNPFGVATGLKALLADGLAKASKAIG